MQVPVMNALKVDCACVGNHDFDFGEWLDGAYPLLYPISPPDPVSHLLR